MLYQRVRSTSLEAARDGDQSATLEFRPTSTMQRRRRLRFWVVFVVVVVLTMVGPLAYTYGGVEKGWNEVMEWMHGVKYWVQFASSIELVGAFDDLRSWESCTSPEELEVAMSKEQRVVKVYYEMTASWEVDYVAWLLLPYRVEYVDVKWQEEDGVPDLPFGGIEVAVVTRRIKEKNFEKLILARPKVVIFTSDEWIDFDSLYHNYIIRLQENGCQILRQYNDPRAKYLPQSDTVKPVWVIPVGFMAGQFRTPEEMQQHPYVFFSGNVSSRPHDVSFIGSVRPNREHMIDVFSSLPRHGTMGPASLSKMITEYSQTNFVVNGRGHENLMCFRIYEAILSGAIPVVRGRGVEGQISYFSGPIVDGKSPKGVNLATLPWVVEDSWEDALEVVQSLLRDRKALHEKQTLLMDWWKRLVCSIRITIHQSL